MVAISFSTAIDCTMLSGGDGFYVERERSPSSVVDASDGVDSEPGSNIADARFADGPVIVDAAPYDSGGAGYIDLAGSWTGSWNQDFTIVGGAAMLNLTQEGGAVSGTAEISGGACPRAGTLTASFVAPEEIAGTFESTDGLLVLNLTSTISGDRKSMKGRFQSVGSCLPGAFGTTDFIRP